MNEKPNNSIRRLPSDFSWVEYRQMNYDLRSFNETQCKSHFLNLGLKDFREYKFRYSTTFDLYEYQKKYNILDPEQAKLHYFSSDEYLKTPTCLSTGKYFTQTVYFLSCVKTGGSIKYMYDLAKSFPYINFKIISSKLCLLNVDFKHSDLIFVQQLYSSDIEYIDILKIRNIYNCKIYMTIHDSIWISEKFKNTDNYFKNYLLNDIEIHQDILSLFKICTHIIHPSLFTYNNYAKYFPRHNFILCRHIDEKVNKVYHVTESITKVKKLNILRRNHRKNSANSTGNIIISKNTIICKSKRKSKIRKVKIDYTTLVPPKKIVLGMMCDPTEVKGIEMYEMLKQIPSNVVVKFKVIGYDMERYDDFNSHLKKYNISGLIYLSKYGETYCYALTKYLNSGLPILYNNFGVFKERIYPNKKHFKVLDNELEYDNELKNPHKLKTVYYKFLHYIQKNGVSFTSFTSKTSKEISKTSKMGETSEFGKTSKTGETSEFGKFSKTDKSDNSSFSLNSSIPKFYKNLFSQLFEYKNLVICISKINSVKLIFQKIKNPFIISRFDNSDVCIPSELNLTEYLEYLYHELLSKLNLSRFSKAYIYDNKFKRIF